MSAGTRLIHLTSPPQIQREGRLPLWATTYQSDVIALGQGQDELQLPTGEEVWLWQLVRYELLLAGSWCAVSCCCQAAGVLLLTGSWCVVISWQLVCCCCLVYGVLLLAGSWCAVIG